MVFVKSSGFGGWDENKVSIYAMHAMHGYRVWELVGQDGGKGVSSFWFLVSGSLLPNWVRWPWAGNKKAEAGTWEVNLNTTLANPFRRMRYTI